MCDGLEWRIKRYSDDTIQFSNEGSKICMRVVELLAVVLACLAKASAQLFAVYAIKYDHELMIVWLCCDVIKQLVAAH